MTRRHAAAVGVLLASLVLVYWDLLAGLVRQWTDDQNYSHGFLIVPLSVYFVYRRRARLRITVVRPDSWGLFVLAAGLLTFAAGTLAADLFLARVSLLPVLAGCVLFLFGRDCLRVLAFPLAFLLLMIPLPAIVLNDLTLPLQLFASHTGELALRAAGVPVLRDGNVIELVGMRLDVAEACSGIRSLFALLTFAVTLGQFGNSSRLRVAALALATIPVAVVINGARIAGTGLTAHVWGSAAATGVLHTLSGTVAFGAAMLVLLAVERVAGRLRLRSVA